MNLNTISLAGMGREEKRNGGGKGEKGKGWSTEKWEVTEEWEGRDRTCDGTGRKRKGRREGKERRGAVAPKLQFLAPPLVIFVFCRLIVLVRLSVKVQVIDWKDSSPK